MKQSQLLFAAAFALAAHCAQGREIRLCTFPQSPTRTVDSAVAHAVFGRMGQPYREVDLSRQIDGGAVAPMRLARLLDSSCDVFAGVATSAADHPSGPLLESQPYADADFVEFSLPGAAAPGSVAVAYRTPAQMIAAEAGMQDFTIDNTAQAVIGDVAARRSAHGIAWYPDLRAYAEAHPETRFEFQPMHTRLSHWTLRFVASGHERVLIGRMSQAIDGLNREGRLQALTAALQVPGSPAQPAEAHAQPVADSTPGHSGEAAAPGGPTAAFAADQVGPGRKLYAAECARCHGDKLEGRTAPALAGSAFAPSHGSSMTVGGIYQYMQTNMPADNPGQLKPAEYADLMAFLLHANGYAPSGKTLTPDAAGNDSSPFDSFVP